MTTAEQPAVAAASATVLAAPRTADRLHAAVMGASALAGAPFWASFIAGGSARVSDDPDYVDFEMNFPLADAYLALMSLATARQLWRGEAAAVGLGIATGSTAVYLGLLDVTYSARHGVYRQRSPGVAMEVGWNALTIGLGAFTMARMWRSRRRFGL